MEIADLQGQNEEMFAEQINKLLIRMEDNFRNQYSQSHKGGKQKKIQLKMFIQKML